MDHSLGIGKCGNRKIILYVGDARDVVKRIKTNHCSGNVEGSAFRKHLAEQLGYKFVKTKRKSGTTRVSIDLPFPREGESRITEYVKTGGWKYIICDSHDEAKIFNGTSLTN